MPIVIAFYLCLNTAWRVRVDTDDEDECRIFRNDVGPTKLICIRWTRDRADANTCVCVCSGITIGDILMPNVQEERIRRLNVFDTAAPDINPTV